MRDVDIATPETRSTKLKINLCALVAAELDDSDGRYIIYIYDYRDAVVAEAPLLEEMIRRGPAPKMHGPGIYHFSTRARATI